MMPENQSIINEFFDAFIEAEQDVKLSEDERQFLAANPKALVDLYNQTSKAILLHAFPAIMAAQIEKATKGDTTSAKFIADFVTPTDEDDSNTRNVEYTKWETQALTLRDRLGLEYSAQDLVVMLLDKLLATPLAAVHELLGTQPNDC